jgi:hypothetical protein
MQVWTCIKTVSRSSTALSLLMTFCSTSSTKVFISRITPFQAERLAIHNRLMNMVAMPKESSLQGLASLPCQPAGLSDAEMRT